MSKVAIISKFDGRIYHIGNTLEAAYADYRSKGGEDSLDDIHQLREGGEKYRLSDGGSEWAYISDDLAEIADGNTRWGWDLDGETITTHPYDKFGEPDEYELGTLGDRLGQTDNAIRMWQGLARAGIDPRSDVPDSVWFDVMAKVFDRRYRG